MGKLSRFMMVGSIDISRHMHKRLDAKFNAWKLLTNGLNFKCKREKKYYTNNMELIKKLDDYCENKNAFKEKLSKYDETTCCKYSNHVKDRKETDELPFPYGHGYSCGYQPPISSEANPEESFNNLPAKFSFTSVSTLLGACLSGLYLYRAY
ncbi:PIR Superfamily Protein [Plasmodium ovale curtisi]|uniref:PIR Superfamily Protein n=1 Tax=Plasmodium ovale curtisi TaxID=864141 RepID=A0A1A8VT27_PLAOA|nr:PIR Superfamily Protein [Plasmodium ovale curtisi]SBT01844.1 PIR Superfamily Protein [Plasmodium ovale curtisi]